MAPRLAKALSKFRIRDDVEIPPSKGGKDVQQATSRPQSARANSGDAIQELAQPSLNRDSTSDRFQLPATIIHSIIAETANDAGERVTRVRSGPLPNPVPIPIPKSTRSPKCGSGRSKEFNQIGRLDIWDNNDLDILSGHGSPKGHGSPRWYGSPRGVGSPREHRRAEEREQSRKEREDREYKKNDERLERKEDSREHRKSDDRFDRDEIRRIASGSLGSGRVLSSIRNFTMDERDRDSKDKDYRCRTSDDLIRGLPRERSYSGPLTYTADRPNSDYRPTNLAQGTSRTTSGMKESAEEKMKAPAQKGPIVQKGRFSVTSDDVDCEDPPQLSARWNASCQGSSPHRSCSGGDWSLERKTSNQPPLAPQPPTSNASANSTAPMGIIIPQLQQILQHGQKQQEGLLNLIQVMSPSDTANFQSLLAASRYSRGSSANSSGDLSSLGAQPRSPTGARARAHQGDFSTDRERELLHQVSELQARMANLVDELQGAKLKNVSLERQLNAIYNKVEEERIRKEEAAKDEG